MNCVAYRSLAAPVSAVNIEGERIEVAECKSETFLLVESACGRQRITSCMVRYMTVRRSDVIMRATNWPSA